MGPATRVRNSFVAGLILVAPLAVTLFVLQFAFARLTGVLDPVVETAGLATYAREQRLLAQLFAAVLLATGITLLGYVASRNLGRRLFGSVERGIRFVPLVRTIYFGVRQVGESLVRRSAGYESVVLVEYPRPGVYSIGFVTNESPRAAVRAVDDDLYNVFIPHSPNPTAGALVMAPAADVHEVDLSVREGLRLLVTTGLGVDDVDDLPEAVRGEGASAGGDAGGARADGGNDDDEEGRDEDGHDGEGGHSTRRRSPSVGGDA